MTILKSCLLGIFIMMCGFGLKAQSNSAFKLFFEKVYLHTDRNVYVQGDTIWYKAYLVNSQNNQFIGTSGNLYVDLISPKVEKFSTEIVKLNNGTGNADFSLPDSIPSGKYRLRAYTNWMRNFGDNFIFEKNITIINTNPEKVKKDVIIPDKRKQANTGINNSNLPDDINSNIFFPEGGSLIEGVTSIVAVKSPYRSIKNITVTGAIISSAGDTVSHFNCDSLGMGMFSLLPVKQQSYYAIITGGKARHKINLPQALTKGLSLSIRKSDTIINIIVNCDNATLTEKFNHNIIIKGQHAGIACFKQVISLSGNQILLRLSENIFPEGLASITLYDDQNKPHSERLIYIHHKVSNTTISIITDKTKYQAREKVTAKIKIYGNGKTNLSLAVIDAASMPVQPGNIETYLMLQSELKGSIESPNVYFDTTNTNRFKQLDLLLMTQGWRDFIWRRLADSVIRISYKAENGIDITGKVKDEKNDKALPGLNVTLYASKATGNKLFSATTDQFGKFEFQGLPYYGEQPVKLSSTDVKGEKKGTFFMDTVTEVPIKKQIKAFEDTLKIEEAAIIKRKKEIDQIRIKGNNILKEVKIRDRKSLVMLNNGMPATTFGYPDQVFKITKKDEYYESLDNWLAHNVQGAIINAQPGVMFTGDGYEAKLGERLMYPRLIVNGNEIVPQIGRYKLLRDSISVYLYVNDDDFLMQQVLLQTYWNLPMDKITDVVLKHLISMDPDYGKTIDTYLLYLTLKEGAMDGFNTGILAPVIKGYYEARTFYKPIYDSEKSLKTADLRTITHWEPNITTDEKGEATVSWYNMDPKAKIRIIAEGIKFTGGPVAGSADYMVK